MTHILQYCYKNSAKLPGRLRAGILKAMRRRNLAVAVLLLLVMGVGVSIPFLHIVYLRWDNEGEYARRKDRYDALLAKLLLEKAPGHRTATFVVGADRDPASLRPLPPDAHDERFMALKEGRCVEVHWMDDDSRRAVFVNRDLGAFGGTLGLIYSVPPPQAGPF